MSRTIYYCITTFRETKRSHRLTHMQPINAKGLLINPLHAAFKEKPVDSARENYEKGR